MTREEAIEILKKNKPTSDPRMCGTELCEAVDMAIEALKEPEQKKGKWNYTADEKPDSTRHVIIAFGFRDISHYGYYLSPKDKWYTDWTCTTETPEPKAWMEMPEIPKDVRCDECCCG